MTESAITYCVNHPSVETALRCKKCESYICPKCAVRTPTGYQCKNCTRAQQKAFNTAEWYDYITAFVVGGIVSFIASLVISMLGMLIPFFGLMIAMGLAPSAGAAIAAIILRVVQRRRSRALFVTAAAAVALAVLPLLLGSILSANLWGIVFQALYLVLVVPTVYYRISGIQLFK